MHHMPSSIVSYIVLSSTEGFRVNDAEAIEKFSLFGQGRENNLWPKTGGKEYQDVITKYNDETHKVQLLLENLFEKIMEVPEGTIRSLLPETMKTGTIRLHLYHAHKKVEEALGAHTDLCTITLVSTDQPGYEVIVDGAWQPVPHLGVEYFVVNLGDYMKAWSNGKLKSSIHRVSSAFKESRRSSINKFAITVAEFPNEPKIILETMPKYVGTGTCYTPLNLREEIRTKFGTITMSDIEK
jgi:isopenicillin N synthase-like dioxygenase